MYVQWLAWQLSELVSLSVERGELGACRCTAAVLCWLARGYGTCIARWGQPIGQQIIAVLSEHVNPQPCKAHQRLSLRRC